MNPRVGRMARPNPFASRHIRPGAVPFFFPEGEGIDRLVDRLRRQGGWGQIVGPHGSGKSTLLAHLLPELQRRWQVTSVVLQTHRRVLSAGLLESLPSGGLLVLDGFEQLRPWNRWRVVRTCRRRASGLLVTTHRRMWLPVLWQTLITPALARQIVAHLVDRHGERIGEEYDLQRLLREHRGDLREVLFALYERFEAAADAAT